MCIWRNKTAMGFGAKEVLTSGPGLTTDLLFVCIKFSQPQTRFPPSAKFQYLTSLYMNMLINFSI